MTALRRTGTTSAAVLSGLVLTLGLTHVSAPEWSRRAGLDVWNLADARASLRELSEESTRLGEESEQLRESIEAAKHITTRLIAGELTLSRATDLVAPLMRERPGFRWYATPTHTAPTFRLSVARYLLDHVQRRGRIDPSQFAELNAQLQAEYEAMK
jgi:hypothetical protein